MAINTRPKLQAKTRLENGQRIDIATNQPYVPSTSPNTAITADSLAPVTPLKLPPPILDTSADGFGGYLESSTASAKTESDRLRTEREKAQETSKSDLSTTLQSILDTNSAVGNAPATIDRSAEDAARKQADEYTSQIEAEALSNRRRIEALQKSNPKGLYGGGLEQEVNRINRESVSKQADLAILQASATRRYDTANAIADRQLSLKLEPLKIKLQNLQFVYKENKENFDKEDDRLYSEAIKKADAELKAQTDLETQKKELKLLAAKNGAPASVLQSMGDAVTYDETVQALGQYASDPLDREYKQAQIDNIYADNRRLSGGGGTGGTGTGDASYASDLDAIIGATLSTIPSKFGQATFQDQIDKTRNDADKINLVAAQVLKGQPAEFKNDFRNQAVGVSMIDKAIAEIDKGTQTGAISASKQYAANFFGKDYDPALAKVNGYITAAIQPYRNSVTGAAWGDQEDAEYQQLFGSIKYSPDELRQRLVQTKELLKSKSAEGLNSFVNPLGVYDNQFETGALDPNEETDQSPDAIYDSVVSPSDSGSSWIGGVFKGLWNSLF